LLRDNGAIEVREAFWRWDRTNALARYQLLDTPAGYRGTHDPIIVWDVNQSDPPEGWQAGLTYWAFETHGWDRDADAEDQPHMYMITNRSGVWDSSGRDLPGLEPIRVTVPGLSGTEITDLDLVGEGLASVQISPEREADTTHLSVILPQDETAGWREAEIEVADTARENLLGGLRLTNLLELSLVSNPMQARAIAHGLLMDARYPFRCEIEVSPRIGQEGVEPLTSLKPGDLVVLQLTDLGWVEGQDGRGMRVLTTSLDLDTFVLRLQLVQHVPGAGDHYLALPALPDDY